MDLNTIKKSFGTVINNTTLSNSVLNTRIKYQSDIGFFKYISNNTSNNTQCIIIFGFKSSTLLDELRYSTELIQLMLNYFILFEKLRLDNGTTYSSKAGVYSNNDIGLFILETQVEFRYLFPVLTTFSNIFKELKTNLVPKELLNRTVAKLKITHELLFQDIREYHKWYNNQAINSHNYSNFITPNQFIKKCSQITPADIKYTANQIFNASHCYLTVFGPKFKHAKILAEIMKHF